MTTATQQEVRWDLSIAFDEAFDAFEKGDRDTAKHIIERSRMREHTDSVLAAIEAEIESNKKEVS